MVDAIRQIVYPTLSLASICRSLLMLRSSASRRRLAAGVRVSVKPADPV